MVYSSLLRSVTRRFLTEKNLCCRCIHVQASRLILEEFGDPKKVVKKECFTVDSSNLRNDDVLVKMLNAPINPADINTIQGVYGVTPSLPFTLGNEGVGKVESVGSSVAQLKVGDWVIPATNAWGTWRSHAVEKESTLQKIPSDIDPITAATIAVNPCTAHRMLHDFVPLSEGDTVLQNGANSAVGQSVIQICRHLGLQTVNVVRNREGVDQLKEELKAMGANFVLTEEELRSSKIFESVAPPKLVLNCVSGKAIIGLVKAVANGGTIVTYGGMSRQPLVVPTSALIFKDIRLVGYWMTRWNWQNKNSPEREKMLVELCSMARRGLLKPPKHQLVELDHFETALAKASDSSGFHNTKFIFEL